MDEWRAVSVIYGVSPAHNSYTIFSLQQEGKASLAEMKISIKINPNPIP